MQVGIVYPGLEAVSAGDFAVRAERKGFESVWVGELWGRNAFVQLAQIAERTSTIRLGSAVVNVYSRSPAVLAMGAAALADAAAGRVVLGLGTSTPKVISDLHGMAYERPLCRTAETAHLLRSFLSGDDDRVTYGGEIFQVRDFPPLDRDVPIYNAALGPRNRRLTGQLFDGWMPNNHPLSTLEESFSTVEAAARGAGRRPDRIEVLPWIHVAVSEDGVRARRAIREVIAYYVGSADAYTNVVKTEFSEEAAVIADAWRAGDTEKARESVTDEMVRSLGIAGTRTEVHEQLRSRCKHPVVDTPILSIPHHLDDESIIETFDALEPSRL